MAVTFTGRLGTTLSRLGRIVLGGHGSRSSEFEGPLSVLVLSGPSPAVATSYLGQAEAFDYSGLAYRLDPVNRVLIL